MLSTRPTCPKNFLKELIKIIKYNHKLPNFGDAETWQRLKRQCYDGTLDYRDFPGDEYKYFAELRQIYTEYKFDGLSKNEAANRERALYMEYENSCFKRDRSARVWGVYQDNIRRFECLIHEINKTPDRDGKLKKALEIIEIITDDNTVMKTNFKE